MTDFQKLQILQAQFAITATHVLLNQNKVVSKETQEDTQILNMLKDKIEYLIKQLIEEDQNNTTKEIGNMISNPKPKNL